MTLRQARVALRRAADPARAELLRTYFKTGPGEYGEGDRFIGVAVPAITSIARRCRGLSRSDLDHLLRSPVNEERATALTILALQYRQADPAARARLYDFYMRRLRYVNNWNLVDGSAPAIAGPVLTVGKSPVLDQLARSTRLWDRRVAVLSTYYAIKQGRFGPTLRLCRLLLRDPHDLIHKACGWMLREVGKRNANVLERFLRAHRAQMPRTMLRYAIERLPPAARRAHLAGPSLTRRRRPRRRSRSAITTS